MNATRINELKQEYNISLNQDVESLFKYIANMPADDWRKREAQEILVADSEEDRFWKIHSFLSLDSKAENALGRQAYSRLAWAWHEKYTGRPDRFLRYLDRAYELPTGDYVVTDPCYFVKDEDWGEHIWDADNLSRIGISHGYMRDTIYGDWSCTLFDDADNEQGQFCADAGLVAVAKLDEILAYNPSFSEWMDEHSWCVATVRDFSGSLLFEVVETGEKSGYDLCDYELIIHLDGCASNGSEIHLVGRQTGA